MFRGDQVASGLGVGMLGGNAALLDNDSGYSSPKTRPNDSGETAATSTDASDQSHLKTQNVHLATTTTTTSIGVSGILPVSDSLLFNFEKMFGKFMMQKKFRYLRLQKHLWSLF